jgi:hypothetical protein
MNLKECDNETKFSLKTDNLFFLSFHSIYYNYVNSNHINIDDDNKDETLNDSIVSADSNIDLNEAEEINAANKEDKMKEMKIINNLFGRLKNITKLVKFRNTGLEDFLRKSEGKPSNKDEGKEKIMEILPRESIENDIQDNYKTELNSRNSPKKVISKSSKSLLDDIQKDPINNLLERKKRIAKEEKEDYDNILSTTSYEAYLKEQNELKIKDKEQPIRETFCSGFFITSFPEKNGSIIEKSEFYPSPCSHKSCSILKSMKPEIIMRYPLTDTDEFEITNLAATLCFPSGIKICYCDSDNKPSKMKDYLTLLTNRKGERLYLMTYHFYLKMKKTAFDSKYEVYPLKFKLLELNEKIKDIQDKEIDKSTFNIFEELKVCKEFDYRTFIYIPYCIALISKYPYVGQMRQSINCIYKFIENQDKDHYLELSELLMYLIHSIPIPNINSLLKFPLPYLYFDENNKKHNHIKIEPPQFKDINILNNNICEILKIFRIKNIIRIFRLLLFEKKIVFIDSDYSRLSNVMNSFISLIYPFQWMHVYIPILTIPMIKYLETFLPFLIGVHSSFIPHIKNILTKNSDEKEQIYLIYIEEDKIRISDYFNGDAKKISKTLFIHKNLNNLPFWMNFLLKNLLTNIKSKMKSIKMEEVSQLNFEIQNAFIEIFVEMFADYNKYIYLVGEEAIFNKNLFLSKRNILEKSFYNEFLDTQMFLQFIQDILGDGYKYFKLKVAQRNMDYNKEKLGQTMLEKTKTVVNENNHAKKLYIIKHKFKNKIKEKKKININENYIIVYLNINKIQNYDYKACKIYLMPTLQTIGVMVKESKTFVVNEKKDISKNKKKTEEEKKIEFQQYKLKDQIKDYVFKIFKKDVSRNESDFKNILTLLRNEETVRKYFIQLISNNLSKVVFLPKNSFDTLFNLIYETLLIIIIKIQNSNDLFRDAVILVKCSMNYGIEEKNKIITIWDLCKEKLMENTLILEKSFWNEWYIFEINNNMNLNGSLLNNVKNEAMVSIAKTMKELKLEKSFILYFTDNLMQKFFENDLDLIEKTKNDIIKSI